MAKFSRIVAKSERTLFKELGIKKRLFLKSLREQEKAYLLFNSYHPGLAAVERCDQALSHLQEIKFHLQEIKHLGCHVEGQKPGRNDVSPHIVWEDGDP